MVKAEEVEPLAPFGQVHDAGLGRLGLQPKLGQQVTQPPKGGLGLPLLLHSTSGRVAGGNRTPRLSQNRT